ncbi:Ent-cassadiene C2-hydroxylase [Capsicum chinense]|nr:Ent-cassadiene C2-hydroxylase [Capsicum chinense]
MPKIKISYVLACVKETLRLHHPVPLLLPHYAIGSYQVMSYIIPKDAQILVNIWAITRDPLIWEDLEMFRPHKFLSYDMDFKRNEFEFLPFSAGRRICPGTWRDAGPSHRVTGIRQLENCGIALRHWKWTNVKLTYGATRQDRGPLLEFAKWEIGLLRDAP